MTTDVQTHTAHTETTAGAPSLRQQVLKTLDNYFTSLGSNAPVDVRSLVLEEVESALYEVIMRLTKGNQSRAALLLGVSRGTLRTKLQYYFNTTHVGLAST
jgi:Fis family transcriptional regulator